MHEVLPVIMQGRQKHSLLLFTELMQNLSLLLSDGVIFFFNQHVEESIKSYVRFFVRVALCPNVKHFFVC